jgi:alkylation response protein AidB-like acyl-CoA dehydrogenase
MAVSRTTLRRSREAGGFQVPELELSMSVALASPAVSTDVAGLLETTREIARTTLGPLAERIDREGLYPRQALQELAAAGSLSAHLRSHGQPGDLGLSIQLISEIARVCGASGFMAWCQAACGVYLEESGNPALTGERLRDHVSGLTLGGTGLSNPIKSYAGIEKLLLTATPDGDGYRLSGSLPWVSHLQPNGYCGVIARVIENGVPAGRDVMVLVPGAAPGLELLPCPAFSGMEGTSTYAIRLNNCRAGPEVVIAEDAAAFIQRIRAVFVLLQCGMGLGVIQGAIDSIRAVEGSLGHVNRFLDEQADGLQGQHDAVKAEILELAKNPLDPDIHRLIAVLDVRARSSELSLKAAQAALLHQGARGYLASSAVQRRIRESHFVAIVTPALKHLRKEIDRLSRELGD